MSNLVNIHIAKLSADGKTSIGGPEEGDKAEEGDASHITDSLDVLINSEKVSTVS